MNVALAKTETGRALSDSFAVARDRLPGTGKVAETRGQAFEAYERAGLPHRRIEDWKYTDLRALMREVLPLAAAPDAAALTRAAAAMKLHAIEGVRRLVLVDGVFVPKLSELGSLEKGLGIRTLREALEAGDAALQAQLLAPDNADAMVALNSAMMTDGVVIDVADGVVLTQPLQIVHIASGADAGGDVHALADAGRQGCRRDPGGKLYRGRGRQGLSGPRFPDRLDRRQRAARPCAPDRGRPRGLQYLLRCGNARRPCAFQHLRHDVRCAASAATRRSSRLPARAPGSRPTASTCSMARQHADTTLLLDHAVPNCTSREIFRAVVDDRAHSVFQGRIIVRPNAQKTDAKMMTRALLLSDEAEADNKPELEIFADDVTCGHGATTGALDESLLFYLRARGLSEKEAQALLIQAFVGEAIE